MLKKTFTADLPNYIKYFFILANLVLTFFVLIYCQAIVKPVLAAFIIALLLKPLSSKLESLKLPRFLSSILAMLLMIIIFTILSFFLFLQIKNISADIDSFINAFNHATDKIQQWASDWFGIAPNEQIIYIRNSSTALLKNSAAFLQNALAATADFFTEFFLFVIAVFFLLYYRSFLASFLFKCFKPKNHARVLTTLKAIQQMVRKYIVGLFLVILTTSTLNTIGLLILGIKHAIFFGCLAGVLTIIPYVGIIIGSFFPFLFAIATTPSFWYPVGVLIVFGAVQFLEGNFITPNIIGNKISLNPFVALLVLFFSGTFFGLLGIILSLPLLATTKIIFDNIPSLKHIGYILGNPPASQQNNLKDKIKHLFK